MNGRDGDDVTERQNPDVDEGPEADGADNNDNQGDEDNEEGDEAGNPSNAAQQRGPPPVAPDPGESGNLGAPRLR